MDRLNTLGTRKQDQLDEQSQIKTGAFGGLNTVTPLLNLPYSDSPRLLNVTSGLSGSMRKRPGTTVAYSADGAVGGFSSVAVRTSSSHHYLVAKKGTSLLVFEVTDGKATVVMEKLNVWNTAASGVKATAVVTNEVKHRVILCTGANTPVQLSIVENATTTSSTGTSFALPDPDDEFKFATTASLLVYRDGVILPATYTVSQVSNTLTVSGLPSSPAGTSYEVVYMSWQWMAEAFRYFGDALYFPTTKFHIDITDQNVAIPSELRDNIFTLTSSRYYPFWAYETTAYGSEYTLSTTVNPTTFDEYHFSNGAMHTPGSTFNPAPNYVTFGNIKLALTQPDEVHVIRGRRLPFNGGLGATGTNVKVIVNGQVWSQNTNAVVPSSATYYLRDAAGAVLTSTSSVAHHLTFDSESVIGLSGTDRVTIVNTEVKDIGSGANSFLDLHRDGAIQPMAGLGLFSVYGKGFHPACVSTYQGRLLFSGWKHDEMRVVASELWDSLIPGFNFVNFDITQNQGLATEPLDVQVASHADDYIVNIYELHNSLFIFTRNAVYSIKPTQGALSPTGIDLARVASIGLVNARSVDATENTLFFLSDTGVYDLTPTIETGDYLTGERSVKIRNLISRKLDTNNQELPFIAYNKIASEIYVAIPTETDTDTASRLFTYSLLRDAWFSYSTPSGFNLWGGTQFIDNTKGVGFLLWTTSKYSSGSPNNLIALVAGNEDTYLDFVTTSVGTGAPQVINLPPTPTTTITTTNNQHEYKPTFDITPFPDVNDLVVTLNGVELTYKTKWVKRANGTIYLIDNPGSGKTLVMRAKRPINEDDVGELNHGTAKYNTAAVTVNNLLMKEGVDYTVSSNGDITLTAPLGASIEVGVGYLSMFSTPMFTQSVLSRFKRLYHFYGFFDNKEGLENFTGLDLTGAQNPDEIVDRPKQRLGVNIAIAFDSGFSSELTYDLYSFASLVWDFSFFDTTSSAQDKPYILFKEPIQGVGYGFQVYFYNWDEKYFDLVGWEVDGRLKGRYSVR